MILRKPYAAFIKYFKLLHAIMAAFIVFILLGSIRLYNFFRIYFIDYRSITSGLETSGYLNVINYLFVILALILTIVLLSVMVYKKKPKLLYIYSVIMFVLILILYRFTSSSFRTIGTTVLDIRLAKAFRDFYLIAILLEMASLSLVVVRATGFDIKQFDFVSDLQRLDISEKDSEEIEVALEFDKDEVKRNFKNRLRNINYVYVEHKFIINILLVLLISTISITVYLRVSAYTARYSVGETFSASSVTLNVKDAYIVNSAADGTKLVETDGENAGAIVLVRFQVKGYANQQTFNTGVVTLNIDKFSYAQNVKHASILTDLGAAYINQKLTSEFQTYTLAFEVPDKLVNKKMYLKINDNNSYVNGEAGAKNILVRLKPVDLRKEGQTFEKKIKETIGFDDSILGSSSLVINSFEISNKFKLNYKYCYATDKCIDSYEYVVPTTVGNYFKTLMKVSGNVMIDQTNNLENITDFRTLLNSYGYIEYLIGDTWKSKKISSELIKPKNSITNDYFIEIPYEVKDAKNININLKIRNQNYKYVLK